MYANMREQLLVFNQVINVSKVSMCRVLNNQHCRDIILERIDLLLITLVGRAWE